MSSSATEHIFSVFFSSGIDGNPGFTSTYGSSTYGDDIHITGNAPAGTPMRFYRMLLP